MDTVDHCEAPPTRNSQAVMRPADVDHGVMTLRDTLRRPRGGATTSDSLGRQGQSYASQRENSQLQCTCNAFVIHRAIHHDSPHFTTRLRIFDSQRGFSLAARAPSALSIVCRFPAILGQINNPKLSLGNIKLYHQIVIEHIEPFQILNMFFSLFFWRFVLVKPQLCSAIRIQGLSISALVARAGASEGPMRIN